MKSVRLAFAFLFFVVLLSPVQAEKKKAKAENSSEGRGDYFHLLNSNYSDILFGYKYQPNTSEDGGDGEFTLQDYSLALDTPVFLSSDSYLKLNLGYEGSDYLFSGGSSTAPGDDYFHKVELGGGFGHFFSNETLFEAEAKVGAYTNDIGSVGEDDIWVSGKSFLAFRVNPGSLLLAGIAYDDVFEDMPLYPLVGVRMLSNDGRFRFVLTAPREIKFSYYATTKSELYLGGWISGNKYRFHNDVSDFDMYVYNQRLGLGIVQWLSEIVAIQFESGVQLGSQLEFEMTNTSVFEGDLEPAPYLSVNVGFAL